MKITKKQLAISLVSIAILLVALAITLCDALIPLKIGVHPILTFLMCIFIGFGILLMVLGFAKKSPWFYFLSAVLLVFSLFYILLISGLKWWLSLIVCAVLLVIIAILSFTVNGNITEDIALNKSSDYKDYNQRKAEKGKIEEDK